MSPVLLALLLTLVAGAATALGGLATVHRALRSDTGLALALAFAAGAMVLVSVIEIVPKGAVALTPSLGHSSAWVATLALVLLAAGLVELVGRLAIGSDHTCAGPVDARRQLRRSGVVVAVAVAAHNLPEGLATFVAALDDPASGATLAVAIALHNIPEGVAVAAPVIGAGGSRLRAFMVATLSGLAEPVGALLGYLLLATLLPASSFGVVFGVVAGVMLHVALSELLPTACRLTAVVPALAACALGGASMGLSVVLLALAAA